MAEQGPSLGWTGVSDKRSYYRLFSGYVLALFATGVATVALAFVAFDLAGDDSGAVIGTALSIKMLAYVFVAPVLTVLTERLPRRGFLIVLDLVRAGSLVTLPFVSEVWHVYLLVFVFASASATFGFVYMAVVPYLLGTEEDYTRSLARSRIASEVEGPLSPLLAASLLLVTGMAGIFLIAAASFLLSAGLVRTAKLPRKTPTREGRLWQKLARGPRLFLSHPAFRAVLAFDVVAALGTAMVMVNTVVIVQGVFDMQRDGSAFAFFAFGAGSVLGAVLMPLALSLASEKRIMLLGSWLIALALLAGVLQSTLAGLLALWIVLGFGVAWVLTPVAAVIRKTAPPADLQAMFAAQTVFANVCLLLAFPLAGWIGAEMGTTVAFAVLGLLCLAGLGAAHWLWRVSRAA